MNNRPINVAVLGSTGSIGQNTLEVIAASNGRLRAVALSTNSRVELALRQAQQYQPRWLVMADQENVVSHGSTGLPPTTEVLVGSAGLSHVASHDEIDVVVAAIVGSAGLTSTWAALEAGKKVALANKETLVMAGALATDLAAQNGAKLLPVDSEHSAIFQTLQTGQLDEVRRIILTASGGPFRQLSIDQLKHVTVKQALAHPTWSMGKKITIDSATMMNKALEIIESRWLFDLRADQIEVVIHPQSIVHSMVEFVDGSVVAQMSPPDMKLPIQYALTYPERWPGPATRFDWNLDQQLNFERPDFDRFPALGLGLEVARAGGSAGTVLNAANEAAVAGFLDGQLAFSEIVPACQSILNQHNYEANPDLQRLMALDAWAREEINRKVCA